jgi:hypothetical protein
MDAETMSAKRAARTENRLWPYTSSSQDSPSRGVSCQVLRLVLAGSDVADRFQSGHEAVRVRG